MFAQIKLLFKVPNCASPRVFLRRVKKQFTIAPFWIAVFWAQMGVLYAAPENPAAAKTGEQILAEPRPGGEQDELFASLEDCEKISAANLRDIYFLKTAVANFGTEKKGDLEKIQTQFAEASKIYYMRDFSKSARVFRENRKALRELEKHMAGVYLKQAGEILGRAADELVKIELADQPAHGSGDIYGKERALRSMRNRLRLANQQIADGEAYIRNKTYRDAIRLFRLAKEQGILLLRDLAADDAARAKILDEMKPHLLDNRNQTG